MLNRKKLLIPSFSSLILLAGVVAPSHAEFKYCIDYYKCGGSDPVAMFKSRHPGVGRCGNGPELIGYDFGDASSCSNLSEVGDWYEWVGFWKIGYNSSTVSSSCVGNPEYEANTVATYCLGIVGSVATPDLGQPQACAAGEGGEGPTPTAGDPITLTNGNSFQVETDLVVANGLSITRYYNSHSMVFQGSQGLNWRHDYEYSLKPVVDDNGKGYMVFVDNDGSEESFEGYLSSPNQWNAYNPRYGIEQLSSGNWVITRYTGTQYTFNGNYQILSVEPTNGLNTYWQYNQDGLLEKVIRPDVGEVVYTHNAQGLIDTATSGGKTVTYEYDGDNRLIKVILPDDTPNDATDNPTRQYHYLSGDDKRLLTGITNGKGIRYVTWTYDSSDRAISSELAGGTDKTQIEYVGSTQVKVTGPLGRLMTYKFTEINGKKHLTRVTGDTTAASSFSCAATNGYYSYNSNGYLTSTTDHKGNITNYQRDSLGRVTQRTEAAGTPEARTIATEWHATLNRPVKITDAQRQTQYTYDIRGRVLSKTVTDLTTQAQRTWTYTYHPDTQDATGTVIGKLATINGPRTDVGDTTTYAYNANHQLQSTTNALGHVTQYNNYDPQGRPQTIIDANGVSTQLSYNWRGQVLQTDSAGQITHYTYDPVGNLTNISRPEGYTMTFEYDDANRLIAIQNAQGARIQYTLDAAGNRIKQDIRDEQGLLTYQQQQVFDELSRLRDVLGNNGQQTQLNYDLNDNLTDQTDALGNGNQYQYDALDRVIITLDAEQQATQVTRDETGQVSAIQDPKGNTTSFINNAFGDTIQRTSPDTGITQYQYDSAGNLIQSTNANGIVIHYQYDALNRLTKIDHSDNAYDVTYVYDEAIATHGIGRLTRIEDASGILTFDYTALGQVAAVNRVLGIRIFTTQYSYDTAGTLTGMILPSGRQISYLNNPAGQVAAIQAQLNSQTKPLASNIAYQPFGPMNGFEYGNQYQVQRFYDFDGQLIQTKMPMGSSGVVDALPLANAGIDQDIYEQEIAQLDATASTSANGALSYQWTQIGGTEVSLSNTATATPSFTTPEVSETQQLVFKLLVKDPLNYVAQDTVVINVLAKPEQPDYHVIPVYGQGNVISLTWDAANAVTYYVVEISTTADFSSDVQQVYQGSDTSFSTTLANSGEYYVRIKACNADRCTDWDVTTHSTKVGYRLVVVRGIQGSIVVPILD